MLTPTLTHRVAGNWQPRTRKLDIAVTALLSAATRHHSPVVRVLFHRGEWEDRPNRVTFRNHIVKLDHNQIQRPGTITLVCLDQQRHHLQVVGA